MADYNDLIDEAPRLVGHSVHDLIEIAILAKEGLKEKLKIKDPSPEVLLEFTRLILDRESELFAREQLEDEYDEDDEEEDHELVEVVLEGATV